MPWMAQIEEIVKTCDGSHITVVYDTVGQTAKSIFFEYLKYENLAVELSTSQDFIRMPVTPSTCYLIDIPRDMQKDELAKLYSALCILKKGKMYDVHQPHKHRRISRPQIIVFTNKLPNFDSMSINHWDVWQMQSDKRLKKYEIDGEASGATE
ncbi:hypothetical protein CYMTET_35592 [Cymbomonas tetramitiformis]|uniref:Uncharacterized protein n=1 Tax=Cymbomonas tetramitiformis TaxID=36881 RepID=A0AAE0F8S9_9CHLO|nr:hypothetical protein CYMTET_35592 [Cymbomonas tetramitiformis]|eukprot:gene1-1_t